MHRVIIDRVTGAVSGLTIGALTLGAVQSNDLDLLRFMLAGSAFVATALVGLRVFVRSEIQSHTRSDAALNHQQHAAILAEVRHLSQRLEDKGVLPAAHPSGEWTVSATGAATVTTSTAGGEGT